MFLGRKMPPICRGEGRVFGNEGFHGTPDQKFILSSIQYATPLHLSHSSFPPSPS